LQLFIIAKKFEGKAEQNPQYAEKRPKSTTTAAAIKAATPLQKN
jgi:hypothetical protein